MSGVLRGFEGFRTRTTTPLARPKRPTCTQCHAVLREGNPGPLCAPCSRGEVDLPEWALTLAELGDGVMGSLVGVLRREFGLAEEEAVDVDPNAPLCECGCGEQTLRLLQSHNGHPQRTGPYQRFLRGGHATRGLRKGVAIATTES